MAVVRPDIPQLSHQLLHTGSTAMILDWSRVSFASSEKEFALSLKPAAVFHDVRLVCWSPCGAYLAVVHDNAKSVLRIMAISTSADTSAMTVTATMDYTMSFDIERFIFSPLSTYIQIYSHYSTPNTPNYCLFENGFITGAEDACKCPYIQHTIRNLPSEIWPPFQWTDDEKIACENVVKQINIYHNLTKEMKKTSVINCKLVAAYMISSKSFQDDTGLYTYIAIFNRVTESNIVEVLLVRSNQENDRICKIEMQQATSCTFKWCPRGESVLCTRVTKVATAKNYYDATDLCLLTASGFKNKILSPKAGGIHHVVWVPKSDPVQFLVCAGAFPPMMLFFDGQNGNNLLQMGRAFLNHITFESQGQIFALLGKNGLECNVVFWDRISKKEMGRVPLQDVQDAEFSPNGDFYCAATTSPGIRINNKIVFLNSIGQKLCQVNLPDLWRSQWRPGKKNNKTVNVISSVNEYFCKWNSIVECFEVGERNAQLIKPSGSYRPPGSRSTNPAPLTENRSRLDLTMDGSCKEILGNVDDTPPVVFTKPALQNPKYTDEENASIAAAEKKVRRLKKKIREIRDLLKKDPESLKPVQITKIEQLAEVEEENEIATQELSTIVADIKKQYP